MLPPPPNCNNPFESSFLKTTSPHQNPTPKSPLFNFPSPFLDEHESPLNQIFSQIETHNPNHHDPTKRCNLGKSKIEAAALPPKGLGIVPRRRAGKKDRHSKICTAQGIRDRRMRLSLQVARKFFDLQDMLGYDKASKTIEWLFTQSKEAINELADDAHQGKTESFASDCEDFSGIEETNSSNVVPHPSKPSLKESRERARERARCRTREKMLVKYLQFSGDNCLPNPNFEIGKLGFSNCPFEGVDQDREIRASPFESSYCSMEQQLSENFSDYADPSSSGLMGFLGNWDDRIGNCFQYYSVMNQVSYGGNLNLVHNSATSEFQ